MNKTAATLLAVALGLSLVSCDSASEQEAGTVASSPSTPEAGTALTTADPSDNLIADTNLTEVVQTYCFVCHNDALMTGNLTLQGFEVENAPNHPETAERMIRKLRAGMMPPPGMPRPPPETLQALVEELELRID